MKLKLAIKIFGLNTIRFFSQKRIIVSLTSYPARYENLHLVIQSLLRQKLMPDLVLLYLYEGEADSLPESLLTLQSHRFRIVRVKENLKPHKKYYYAFRDYPDDLIITVDDDYIYPSDLVMNLYRKHLAIPDAVVCGRCRMIRADSDGKLLPYNSWPICYSDTAVGMNLLATGVGGVLYSPKLLDERVLDMQSLKRMAMNQDDMWLKTMEILKGTKTAPVTLNWKEGKPLSYEGTLFSTNEFGENDACLKSLLQYYHVLTSSLSN